MPIVELFAEFASIISLIVLIRIYKCIKRGRDVDLELSNSRAFSDKQDGAQGELDMFNHEAVLQDAEKILLNVEESVQSGNLDWQTQSQLINASWAFDYSDDMTPGMKRDYEQTVVDQVLSAFFNTQPHTIEHTRRLLADKLAHK